MGVKRSINVSERKVAQKRDKSQTRSEAVPQHLIVMDIIT